MKEEQEKRNKAPVLFTMNIRKIRKHHKEFLTYFFLSPSTDPLDSWELLVSLLCHACISGRAQPRLGRLVLGRELSQLLLILSLTSSWSLCEIEPRNRKTDNMSVSDRSESLHHWPTKSARCSGGGDMACFISISKELSLLCTDQIS